MDSIFHSKRTAPCSFRGRGVMAALLAFNQSGGGSSPSDLIMRFE